MAKDGGPRGGSIAVWTGRQLIVWGSTDGGDRAPATGLYDPVADRWTPVDPRGGPPVQQGANGVWTGRELIVWEGYPNTNDWTAPVTGGRLDPVMRRWQPMSRVNAPTSRAYHSMVWTGAEIIVWGGLQGLPGQGNFPAKDAAA